MSQTARETADYYASPVQIGKGPFGMIWAALAGQVVISGGILTLYNNIDKNKVVDSAPLSDVTMHMSKIANSAVWVEMHGRKYSVAINSTGSGLTQTFVVAEGNAGFIAAFEALSGKKAI